MQKGLEMAVCGQICSSQLVFCDLCGQRQIVIEEPKLHRYEIRGNA